jgi:hypothetical protein
MSKHLHGLLVAMMAAAPAAAADLFPLAEGGKARQAIVVGERAGPGVRQLAAELADYLARITGGKFEVRTGDGTEGIVLGTPAEVPCPDLARELEIRNTFDGREAYAIRTEARRLRLIGATELGLSHAVFHFLESLGCRWYFPAREWEIVPAGPTLRTAINETGRPAILSRTIWYGYGFFEWDRCRKDYEAWCRHNRMAGSFSTACGHAWQTIIAQNQKAFDGHPEYLALTGGKRQGPQMCVSNPAVRKIALEYALDHFRRHPESDMVSLETSDGSGHCECAACKRLGSISDRLFGLANEVARELSRQFPGKMVGCYAYNDHCEPPSFALEPNVYVQSTAGFIRGRYTFDELMDLWPKRCRSMGFYDYFSVWLWDWDMPPGGRGADVNYIRRQIPRYAAHGATSISCESGNNWGLHGRGYYLASRLMWDPKGDADAILDDFYRQAFGPAAATVQRYYERLDPGRDPLMSEHLLGLALRDLAEAAKLAAERPDVIARLDQLEQYQHYVRLRWDYNRAADKDRKRDLALAILTHCYRTRYTYMNHWTPILRDWAPKLAEELGRPEWNPRDQRTPAPWQVETPLTHAETQRLFQEDLARFQPAAVEPRSFAGDLVPGSFHVGNPAASRQSYQGSARYAFYSQGEPLEMTITTGIIAWYRDRAEARYAISDAAGKLVATARLPQDGQEHRLSVAVPKPGLYWLEFDDQGAGWGLAVAAGRPLSLDLVASHSAHHMGHMQPMFFYVPSGTRQIQYFWEGYPHQVYDPNGKPATSVTARGVFVSVPVPPGSDGRVWSFRQLCLERLRFFNVPNYLAASPEALLVPAFRDAAEEGDAPPWAKTAVPDTIRPFLGRHGLGKPWCDEAWPLAVCVAGIDRWQANHFVVYRKETAGYLYSEYTPGKIEYAKGLFPALEKAVAQYAKPGQSDRQRAMALLTEALPNHLRHPSIPPTCGDLRADRGLDDEGLWASGGGWCNEQARVFVRLCQIAGIPARMIFLFYADGKSGHVVAEFFADGHWCMADASMCCAFPDDAGRLLSAAELHAPAARPIVERTYRARSQEILKLSDARLAPNNGAEVRKQFLTVKLTELGQFGVLNYPLPHVAAKPPAGTGTE